MVAQPASAFSAVLEPAGSILVTSQDGSTLSWGSGWSPSAAWSDADRIEVVSDPASKYGSAIEKRGFIGDTGGWLKANNVNQGGGLAAFREYYFRFVFLASSNWQAHTSGDKLFYYGRKFGSGQATQYYLMRTPGGRLRFTAQNTLNGDGTPVNFNVFAVGVPNLTRGVYHTVEVLHRLNVPGQGDGYLRMAVDGVEASGYSGNQSGTNPPAVGTPTSSGLIDVEWVESGWSPLSFNGTQQFLFWGGSGGQKTVNDHWRLSELYIAGRN